MRGVPVVAVVVGIACGLAAGPPCRAEKVELSADEREAVEESATSWLRLVDRGKYASSWNQACEFFRAHTESAKWQQTLTEWRQPLGNMVSRKLKTVTPGINQKMKPPTKLTRLTYETEFEQETTASEVVVLYLEGDGEWRMSGYFIRRVRAKPASPAGASPSKSQPAPAGKITILNRKDAP